MMEGLYLISRERELIRQCHLEPKMGIKDPRRVIANKWCNSCLDFDQEKIDYGKSSCECFKIGGNFNTHEGTNNQANPKYHTLWFSNTTCFGDGSVKHDDLQVKIWCFTSHWSKVTFQRWWPCRDIFRNIQTAIRPFWFNWCRTFNWYDSHQPNVQHFKEQTCSACNKNELEMTNPFQSYQNGYHCAVNRPYY